MPEGQQLLPAKPWWKSRTLWVNTLFFLSTLFTGTAVPGVAPRTSALVAAATNAGLRALTRRPLGTGADGVDG